MSIREHRNVWAGMAAGMTGGLTAAWVMNRYRNIWDKIASDEENQEATPDQNPTVKTAMAVSENVLERRIPEYKKAAAGSAVHYIFGTAVGAAYGVISELAPATSRVAGLPFGAAVWLGADEIALPLLRLAPNPTETPLSAHALGITSHLVYGVVTDGVRRAVRKLFR